jgi:aminoglycoside phosphotransferase (APT) family kinase protein
VADQFPQWARLPVTPFDSAGTGNMIYRLGEDLCVRLPRIERASQHALKEAEWLPRLAPGLPLAVPTPLGLGRPAHAFPLHWAIYRWLDGDNPTDADLDYHRAAADLGRFVAALRRADPTGGPIANRGRPLAVRERETRAAIEALRGRVDVDGVTAAWEQALATPPWDGPPHWVHGDLHAANLLSHAGRITAVIDFGSSGTGDPACDLMAAWTLLTARTRDLFRAEAGVDDATWARGRGWALTFGVVALPYYEKTNPMLAAIARSAIEEVLADHGGAG